MWVVTIVFKSGKVTVSHEQVSNPGLAIVDRLFVDREGLDEIVSTSAVRCDPKAKDANASSET